MMVFFWGGGVNFFAVFRYDEEYFQRHYFIIRNMTGGKVSTALQNITFNKSFNPNPLSTYILRKLSNCDSGEIWYNFLYLYIHSPNANSATNKCQYFWNKAEWGGLLNKKYKNYISSASLLHCFLLSSPASDRIFDLLPWGSRWDRMLD